jgi:hypothetical protein
MADRTSAKRFQDHQQEGNEHAMTEPENNEGKNDVRLDERVGMSLPDDHAAIVLAMPGCWDQTYRGAQA